MAESRCLSLSASEWKELQAELQERFPSGRPEPPSPAPAPAPAPEPAPVPEPEPAPAPAPVEPFEGLVIRKEHRHHGGLLKLCTHFSAATSTPMDFTVYLPPAASTRPCHVLYFLSGLTCSDENFTNKAGAFKAAAEEGLIIVVPDTSPRGAGVPREDESMDFGTAAGWYVDATAEPWKTNYKMYSYITQELPALVSQEFPVSGHASIMGHSMGGMGALQIAFKKVEQYASVSALAPVCHPAAAPKGRAAFAEYLGPDEAAWDAYDPTALVQARGPFTHLDDILVDQGAADEFLVGEVNELCTEAFQEACAAAGQKLTLRMQAGLDHSYFFVSELIADHIAFHAAKLARAGAGMEVTDNQS